MAQITSSAKKSLLVASIVTITCCKFLLIPAYRSTDFDVHRNWLAITRNLPLSQWYFDDNNKTTVHTLDYPPLFALFEAFLSNNAFTNFLVEAELVDKRCFELLPDDDNDPTDACVFFQRFTVIFSDVVFICGAVIASHFIHFNDSKKLNSFSSNYDNSLENITISNSMISALLIILNPGILLLDHVHFQYNGMLLGLLLLSIGFIARSTTSATASSKENNNVIAAFFFALLLTMKHLYLTLAPLYFIFLLRYCCFHPNGFNENLNENYKKTSLKFSLKGFMKLATCTAFALTLPFFPFLKSSYLDQLPQMSQILKRLFPFARGLCHDYWAANVWALYLFAEKCVTFVLKKIGWSIDFIEITPLIAATLLLVSLIPAMILIWQAAGALLRMYSANAMNILMTQSRERIMHGKMIFVHAVVYCSFCSFMLAYHVHEKAIMTAIIPMTLISPTSRQNAQLYLRTCALGHFALLPLLYQQTELLFKTSCLTSHLSLAVFLLEHALIRNKSEGSTNVAKSKEFEQSGLLTKWDKFGAFLMAFLYTFSEVIHPLFFKSRRMLEFLPLMMISVVCAVGLVGCWIHSGIILMDCALQLNAKKEKKKIK